MSTTTTNYGLIKPDTTDPILIGQLNDNADAIDAALKENADAIENKPDAADIPTPSTAAPAMDGTAAAGTSTDYARADHVHPSDTSKQDALTAAQLAAVNSGINSAKVEQIKTNKNNILSLTANGGGKNKLQITATSTAEMTINADKSVSITVNATTTKQYNLTNWIPNDYAGMKISGMTVDSNVSTGYFISAQYSNNGSSWTNETDIATMGSATILDYPYIRIAIVVRENNNINDVLFKPMISADGGDYQPYAMSNAELTAAIQAIQAQLANQ